jgi:hypothetical protein
VLGIEATARPAATCPANSARGPGAVAELQQAAQLAAREDAFRQRAEAAVIGLIAERDRLASVGEFEVPSWKAVVPTTSGWPVPICTVRVLLSPGVTVVLTSLFNSVTSWSRWSSRSLAGLPSVVRPEMVLFRFGDLARRN